MKRLLCIGHLNIEDTVYPDQPPVWKAAGGAALYTSTAARIWDINVSIVSRAGENYPDAYLSALRAGGVDTQLIRRVPGPTMAGRTSYLADGGRIYQMYADAPRRLALTPQPVDWPNLPTQSWDAAHIATMPPAVQSAWIDQLRPQMPFLSLDTDISFIQQEREAFAALLRRVDVVFPNQAEAQAFAPHARLDEAAALLLEGGPRIVVIKRAEQGATVYSRTAAPLHIPPVSVNAVDVTGAGDSFAGGFLAGWLLHGDLQLAARMGAFSAAMAISGYGGLHTLSNRDEAASFLESIPFQQ